MLMDTTSALLYTFVDRKSRFVLFNTTDNDSLEKYLHYSEPNKTLFVNHEIFLIDFRGKPKKYKIVDLTITYWDSKIINDNRNFTGQTVPYNNQLMVYVDALE
jgi:hypothetical protein